MASVTLPLSDREFVLSIYLGLSLQKEFVRQIQSSGVLVVLSQAWIEELYHQVLEKNLLGEAGYWGSPEDHSLPLITMLTGGIHCLLGLI